MLSRTRVPAIGAVLLYEVLKEAGLDAAGLFAGTGASIESLRLPGARVDGTLLIRLQRGFLSATRDRPGLWVAVGRRMRMATCSICGLSLLTSPTLAAFVGALGNSELFYTVGEYAASLDGEKRLVGFSVSFPQSACDMQDFWACVDLGSGLETLDQLWGRRFSFRQIQVPFRHEVLDMRRFTPSPVQYGSDRLVFAWEPEDSEARLPYGDEQMHELFLSMAVDCASDLGLQRAWSVRVADAVRANAACRVTLADAAAALFVTPRTLQRRLEDEGTTFTSLRDATLRDAACRLLAETNRSVAVISKELGYRDVATFSSSFRRWVGLTPRSFRSGPARSSALAAAE
jgi:AraC-like DNA-binding protein